jgi:hypothetical protein
VNLAFASEWNDAGARIEINNPTGRDITTVVRTPAAVTSRKPLQAAVAVTAGTTVYVDLRE